MQEASKHSTTVENYLKALYYLQTPTGEVNTNALADHLETKASSVTDMLKKLAKEKLVKYTPYKGARLTDTGEGQAIRVLRKHRLWEAFLVNKLNFSWDQVHDIAEQLEHVKSPELTDRLDAFLNFPATDPHGDPIPDANGKMRERPQAIPLVKLKVGEKGVVVGVEDSSAPFLKYLNSLHLELGTEIALEEIFEFDQSVSISYNRQSRTVSKAVAHNLLIQKQAKHG